MDITPVILTGGQSRRMGQDKGTLKGRDGETMLSRLVARYQAAFGTVYVSMNEAGRFDPCGGIPLVDLRPNQGPLAGLETALTQLEGKTIFLTAVDLPFGDVALVEAMYRRLSNFDGCYICHDGGRVEPLFSLYRPTCLQPISQYLSKGRRSFYGLMSSLNLRAITPEEVPEFNLNHILTNVNRPEDWAAIQKDF